MGDYLINALKAHASSLDQTEGRVKFGTVTSVDYQTATARVKIQPDGVLSGWLPVLSQWVGDGWGLVCPPNPGDQVLLIPQEGDIEQGIIIGRAFSNNQRPPAAPENEFWLVHKTGSFLKLCNDGTIRVNGDLHVQGDVYDRVGALSHLRTAYNSHTYRAPTGGTTTGPSNPA
jgi:phage baseplate assembly protein V